MFNVYIYVNFYTESAVRFKLLNIYIYININHYGVYNLHKIHDVIILYSRKNKLRQMSLVVLLEQK